MKWLGTLLLLIICAHTSLLAQQVDVSLSYLTAYPNGSYELNAAQGEGIFATTWPTEITPGNARGAGIQFSYRFEFGLSIALEANYLNYKENVQGGSILGILNNRSAASAIQIPLFISASYYFLDDWIRPHAGIGAGYNFHQTTVVSQGLFDLAPNKLRYNQDGFVLSPRLGVLFQATDFLAFNLHAQYNLNFNELTNAEGISRSSDNYQLVDIVSSSSTDNITVGIGLVFTILSND